VPKQSVRSDEVYSEVETDRNGELIENGLVVAKNQARPFYALASFSVEPETVKQVQARSKAGTQHGEYHGTCFFYPGRNFA